MQIGFVGLGKMGMNMVTRLIQGGHQVIATDTDPNKRMEIATIGAQTANDLSDLVQKLSGPKAIWIMVPAGEITEKVIGQLTTLLSAGDIIIDGGNSNFRESIARSNTLIQKGIHLLDTGTSGGIWGLKNGYCLMVGGAEEAFSFVEPVFETLAPKTENGFGYLHVGPSGSGHYVKMIHNAIEYGMMQAYGEGFAMLEAAKDTFGTELDLGKIGHLWGQGSVVRSWLLELLVKALQEDPGLRQIEAFVQDSGEGRWTVKESIDAAVPTPVLTLALQMRFLSRLPHSFSAKACAALRNQFGGHAIKTTKPPQEASSSQKRHLL